MKIPVSFVYVLMTAMLVLFGISGYLFVVHYSWLWKALMLLNMGGMTYLFRSMYKELF